MKGYIQVYTGNGKGKTTASLGLALRAAGAGLHVYIAQFLKKGDYSEIQALKKLSDYIVVEQFGTGKFIKGVPSQDDVREARRGLEKIKTILATGETDVVIMEEGNVAIQYDLFTEQEVLDILAAKPEHIEIVITGRGAKQSIIKKADLVTEMKEIKHYFSQGVGARRGIEK